MLRSFRDLRRHALRVYLIIETGAAVAGALYGTISAVYRIQTAGFNPLQLVLVGTALEASYFVANIPTGVVADVYSRRLSVVIGLALIGAGFILEGSLPLFATILLAQAVWGTGASFLDGAREAWLAGEIGDEHVGKAFLRAAQVGAAGGILGAIVSVLIAGPYLGLPMIAGGLVYLALAVFAALVMPEEGFQRVPREQRSNSLREMVGAFRRGGSAVWRSPLLITILSIAFFAGMASEGFDRLWQAHLVTDIHLPALGRLQPIAWFGIISVVAELLGIGVTEIVRRYGATETHHGATRALFAIDALLVLGVVGFGLSGNLPLALGAYWGVSALRGLRAPIYVAWLSQRVDARVRATVLSMGSQMDALGQVGGGPVIGLIGTLSGLRAALVTTGIALAPALPLVLLARRQGKEPEAPALTVTPASSTTEPV